MVFRISQAGAPLQISNQALAFQDSPFLDSHGKLVERIKETRARLNLWNDNLELDPEDTSDKRTYITKDNLEKLAKAMNRKDDFEGMQFYLGVLRDSAGNRQLVYYTKLEDYARYIECKPFGCEP